jgi:hypothetical protein
MNFRHQVRVWVVTACVALPSSATSQLAKETLNLDLGSGVISGTMPFDVPFVLTGAASKSLLKVRLWYAPTVDSGGTASGCSKVRAPAAKETKPSKKTPVDTVVRPTNNSVTFGATGGSFQGSSSSISATVVANDTGFARVMLVAPGDGAEVIVSATAASVSRTATVMFVPAPPQRVILTTSKFALAGKDNEELTVTASLQRIRGTPSPGATVTFNADTVGGNTGKFGTFIAATAVSSSPTVTTRYSTGTVPFRGRVVIRVSAARGNVVVTDSVFVQIINP